VPDLTLAVAEWGWLLTGLGYRPYQDWPDGRSWCCADGYLVVERSPALETDADGIPLVHRRCRAGLNHLALHAGDHAGLDALVRGAPQHGWRPLFPDRYPFAGGPGHYAAYLENSDGFEVELVADPASWTRPPSRTFR
jgi:hypothetical protein